MALIRTGYSFRTAVGHLDDIAARLKEIEWTYGPIADRCSTFGFNRWSKVCQEHNLRAVYGVELAVVVELGAKKPTVDYWTFIAQDDIAALHELIWKATSNPGREPSLTYTQAQHAEGVTKIVGPRVQINQLNGNELVYLGLSPASPRGLVRKWIANDRPLLAVTNNYFPREQDREFYRVTLGRFADNQSYPQHILSDDEWYLAMDWLENASCVSAMNNRDKVFKSSSAKLKQATLLRPDHPLSLHDMCIAGAKRLNVDLNDEVYATRLKRELDLIAEKQFEDYFFIIADMVMWAKEHMVVGPARGSSCGSLVCYLLGITSIDPIPHGLIFERFIDTTRADLPDIDLDFSDERRQLVFDYVESKYGPERVARLGTVGMFQPRSALNQAGIALKIPKWQIDKVSDSIIQRSSGDSRAMQQLEDTLKDTESGRKLLSDHPNILIAAGMEGHPNVSSQHAAGIVITQEPVRNYVAIDARTRSAMCDKKDAEDLNLLKIDALGLTQLSIFERTLQLIGKPDVSGYLETLPLDDPAAFDVLNKGNFSGIFQFMGGALKGLTRQVTVTKFDDIVNITALARPGPMVSGQAGVWTKRRTGKEPVNYPHPAIEPYLRDTLGTIIYQEQILQIGREVGDLSWGQVTQLRKAMSKSLGKEYFDQFGNPFKAAAHKKGIPMDILDKLWDDLTSFGAWCLSGDTVLVNPQPNQHSKKTFTLRELYESGGYAPGARTQLRRQKLFCLQDGSIKPATNILVTQSGEQETWAVTASNGCRIRATINHEFLCSDGQYRRLKDLKVGDNVLMMGDSAAPTPATIVSIDEPKIEMTYDVSMPPPNHNFVADGFIVHNCFNKSHAVAYGTVSYWCCWLKAHHPVEFAAATLDAEKDPSRQIALLRELKDEGISYVPIDPDHSTDRWMPKDNVLVGPLMNVKGIGPKTVQKILTSRKTGEVLPPSVTKRLAQAKTEIDTLFPVRDRVAQLHPDLAAINIVTKPTMIIHAQPGLTGDIIIIGVAKKIAPRDENEAVNVAKRGGRVLSGPTQSLNLFLLDDTDEVFCKIDRFHFERMGRAVVERGRVGKAIYAIKGEIPRDFRMIKVRAIRYLGDMTDD